jgi:hypothetical protein
VKCGNFSGVNMHGVSVYIYIYTVYIEVYIYIHIYTVLFKK